MNFCFRGSSVFKRSFLCFEAKLRPSLFLAKSAAGAAAAEAAAAAAGAAATAAVRKIQHCKSLY